MENLEAFVNRLIEEKGFAGKDIEIVEQIRLDLLDRVEDQINAMIMSNLPEDSLKDFQKSLESKDNDASIVFIKKHIPDLDEKVAEVLMSFKIMYLGQ